MGRLGALDSCRVFGIRNWKLEACGGCCPFEGLSSDTILGRIQSGRTVPLRINFSKNDQFYFFHAEEGGIRFSSSVVEFGVGRLRSRV
jgi:hypothetical protein